MDTAIPPGIIINELVSNSLKHAFPERKEEILIKHYRTDVCDEENAKLGKVDKKDDVEKAHFTLLVRTTESDSQKILISRIRILLVYSL